MIIIVGLIVLIAAVVIGGAGVLVNDGSGHALTQGFAVFGYHVTGSTGMLFLFGIVTGALGLADLSLLLAGTRRTSRRAGAARPGLRQSRQGAAAASHVRDGLIGQRDTAHTRMASTPGTGAPRSDLGPGEGGSRQGRLPGADSLPCGPPLNPGIASHAPLRSRSSRWRTATAQPATLTSRAAAGAATSAPGRGTCAGAGFRHPRGRCPSLRCRG